MYTIVLGAKRRKEGKVLDKQLFERLQEKERLYPELTIQDKFMILSESEFQSGACERGVESVRGSRKPGEHGSNRAFEALA